MTEIRAFVGHSFTDDDAEVVGKFLKYFDQLSKIELKFSWEHAEAAEPKVLADKVMSLLADKNVFIGICTKKERVIPDNSLTKAFFRPSVRKAQEKEFHWKTSDWIIQEIGLAKGKKLDLILLVERGVREPGGLQGNVEYIKFDRAAPHVSFGKILEMINALSPKPPRTSATSSDTRSLAAEEESEPDTPADDDWTTPKPGWSRRHYEFAFMHMALVKNTEGIAEIDKAYLETEDAAHVENRVSWDAFGEFTRLRLGQDVSLAKLKALADAHPDSSETLRYFAQAYEKYQEYAKAASIYERAASKNTDDTEALRLKGRAAVAYVRAELAENASAIVKEMKIQVEECRDGEIQLLQILRKLAELAKEDEPVLAIMERIVEIDPSDIDTRFSLAYKHSGTGNKDLALLHYLMIPNRDRSSMTWNNLGVAFDHFSLPAKSVVACRTAAGMGETLAMSNLAKKFISAGFLPEAQEQCDDALAITDFHKNVGHDIARLKSLPDEEDDKEAELLIRAKPKSTFYKQFGRAVSRPEPSELAERWEGPDCVLLVKSHGGAFNAVGSYERPSSGLLAGVFLGLGGRTRSEKKSVRFRVEYSGTLRGWAIEAHVTRFDEDEPPKRRSTLLSSMNDKPKVLMVLTDDGNELIVMESPQDTSPMFYTLRRQADNA